MKDRKELKKDVKISTLEIVDFLKKENLYISNNNIENISTNISALENSNETSLSWIGYSNYDTEKLNSSILIVGENFKGFSSAKSIIYTLNPRLAMVLIINSFFMEIERDSYISKSAKVDDSAKIGKNSIINENVVISKNCIIGDNVTLYPDVVLYPDTVVKDNVVLNAGVKIGQEGFGYIKDLNGINIQFPHLGRVIIESGVEIGSNTCIDRGALLDTIIGENSKINNLCHIAHNTHIEKNCLIAAKVEISGSVAIGEGVYIGPNATIIDGVTIGSNATIGMGAIIRKDVKAKSTMVPLASFEKRAYIKALKRLQD